MIAALAGNPLVSIPKEGKPLVSPEEIAQKEAKEATEFIKLIQTFANDDQHLYPPAPEIRVRKEYEIKNKAAERRAKKAAERNKNNP